MEVDFIIGKLKPNKLTSISEKEREDLNLVLFQYGKLNAKYGCFQGICKATMAFTTAIVVCVGIGVGIKLLKNKKEKTNE